jgi:general secretion pathway protein K
MRNPLNTGKGRVLYDCRGAALFLVLWALLVVSVSLIVAVRLVDHDLESETIAAKRFEARQLALSGLAVASHPEIEARSQLLFNDFGDGRSWQVRIESENSRLNINRILLRGDTTPLRSVLALWGLDERRISTILDSLTDWVDGDDLRSLNGAEAADIPLDSGWSRPENRPFLDIAEMERVRGMEWIEEAKPDWREFFSVQSGRRLDLQFVAPDLLVALGEIDPNRAERFVRVRDGEDRIPGTEDDVVFESLEDAMAALGASARERANLESMFSAGTPGLRRIISRGEVAGTAYVIEAILSPGAGGPTQTLGWREF